MAASSWEALLWPLGLWMVARWLPGGGDSLGCWPSLWAGDRVCPVLPGGRAGLENCSVPSERAVGFCAAQGGLQQEGPCLGLCVCVCWGAALRLSPPARPALGSRVPHLPMATRLALAPLQLAASQIPSLPLLGRLPAGRRGEMPLCLSQSGGSRKAGPACAPGSLRFLSVPIALPSRPPQPGDGREVAEACTVGSLFPPHPVILAGPKSSPGLRASEL